MGCVFMLWRIHLQSSNSAWTSGVREVHPMVSAKGACNIENSLMPLGMAGTMLCKVPKIFCNLCHDMHFSVAGSESSMLMILMKRA
eukprot:11178162-Ditylum_brightwellii.AAC.1